ncbi:uncharacterized protein [Ptychodera flava]|uniref:uncharacterized protein n=1 Tax=Ptychodera flava TaxID=63121 RepID=UPI00396A3543
MIFRQHLITKANCAVDVPSYLTSEAIRARNLRRVRDKPKRGNIDFTAPSEREKLELQQKFNHIRTLLGGRLAKASNYDMLLELTHLFIQKNSPEVTTVDDEFEDSGIYQATDGDKTTEQMLLTTPSSIQNLVSRLGEHGRVCDAKLQCVKTNMMGHTGRLQFKCNTTNCEPHRFSWYSSSFLPNGKFLVNYRMLHAITSSGLREQQYETICGCANMGFSKKDYRKTFYRMYQPIVAEAAQESKENALLEETASYYEVGEIEVMSDARHATRKNAKQSEIVFLSDRTHKCIFNAVITRDEDDCTQRHEMGGVRSFYQWADDNGVQIKAHAHDRNASVNKYLREQRPDVINSLDTWHVTKEIGKQLKKITGGARKNHGKIWHQELADKGASIKTHFYWCMKRSMNFLQEQNECEETQAEAVQLLRRNLLNIVDHYRGNHAQCHEQSRCSMPGYEPSHRLLESPVAINLLTDFIMNNTIYKQAGAYIHCKDTHYVESYNNVCLLYQNKRVVFSNGMYRMRSDLTTLDWNENVDRPATSVTFRHDARAPRRR